MCRRPGGRGTRRVSYVDTASGATVVQMRGAKWSDRVMSVKLGIGETVVNVVCAYAHEVGCAEEEKETFWRQMDQELRAIPEGERVIV